ncbi:MAG: Subtilisin-like serine protease, partial [Ignavibacteriaceae bacterium]|nr:Subtilisin-like serine protease [Ignavibacteriaceae bacterium]
NNSTLGDAGLLLIESGNSPSDVTPDHVALGYSLSDAFPNPFNPITTIQYEIGELSFVSLKIYDLLGSEVAALVNEVKPAGIYEVFFDASGLPSGTYFYTLVTDNYTLTKKMILMK